MTALHFAALHGHVEFAKRLIAHDADVSAESKIRESPVNWASVNGHVSMLKLLAEHKAALDTNSDKTSVPLHTCAARNMLPAVKFLLEQKIDPDIRNAAGEVALHFAAVDANLDVHFYFLRIFLFFQVGCCVRWVQYPSRFRSCADCQVTIGRQGLCGRAKRLRGHAAHVGLPRKRTLGRVIDYHYHAYRT